MSREDFVEFLVSIAEETFWNDWCDLNYCSNCETISDDLHKYTPCEKGASNCPFHIGNATVKDIVNMWLDSKDGLNIVHERGYMYDKRSRE